MRPTPTPFFSENPLDKMDYLRPTIDIKNAPGATRFILFSEGQIILRASDQQSTFSESELSMIQHDKELSLFLGSDGEEHYFAVSVSLDASEDFEQLDLRTFVSRRVMPVSNLGMVAQAGSVFKWHESHQFCANCGTKTTIAHSGWRRDCSKCEKQHFPRLDPVIIMMVTHGDNCIIGASHHYPENFYSCLAGFIEPGETIENAARREVFEEVGVVGGHVRYVCSQPWPFPHSLMIGVHMEAETAEMTIDEKEIREARWVSKQEIIEVMNNPESHGYYLPPSIAIARTLFKEWIAE
ncbi:MAG: NAD(+) diphosphatase [Methyloligellaceae bacterium]